MSDATCAKYWECFDLCMGGEEPEDADECDYRCGYISEQCPDQVPWEPYIPASEDR